MGMVYRAKQLKLDREVAIKVKRRHLRLLLRGVLGRMIRQNIR